MVNLREWNALQVCWEIKGETETKPVDLRLSIIKPLCAKWIVSLYEYIKRNPALVSNGFKHNLANNLVRIYDDDYLLGNDYNCKIFVRYVHYRLQLL